jgi:hypothetical protein
MKADKLISKIQFVLLLFLFAALSSSCYSQQMELQKIEYLGGKVVVHYNLTDTVVGRFYVVRLYASTDNYLNPLVSTRGDVGLEVSPGFNKKIVWDPITDLGASFSGKVALKIRARLFIPFVKFESFKEYKAITRSRPYNVTWSGGTPQNILNFDLYRGEVKIAAFPNIANVGHYKLTLPSNVRPGDEYRIKISDSKNKDEVVYTESFSVKRRIPLAAKVAALVLTSGAIYYLTLPPKAGFVLPGAPTIK